MAQQGIQPPNIPLAPSAYERQYHDQVNNVLRLFFKQITNPGDVGATTLNFDLKYLPTDADFDKLRAGDVYYDTSGGTATSYVLRVKS